MENKMKELILKYCPRTIYLFVVIIEILAGRPAVGAEYFMNQGKWSISGSNNYICVPAKNEMPSVTTLAIQFAANFSTGDGRWVGECSTKKLKKFGVRGFTASLECTQKRTENGKSSKFYPIISAQISHDGNYHVKQNMAYFSKKSDSFTSVYTHTSNHCGEEEGYTPLKIPKKLFSWASLNPDFVNLLAFPDSAIYFSKP